MATEHTFTVTIPITLNDRSLETVDWAVGVLRGLPGVVVTGWGDGA